MNTVPASAASDSAQPQPEGFESAQVKHDISLLKYDDYISYASRMIAAGQAATPITNNQEVAADTIIAWKGLRDDVLSDEILSAINTLADKLPEAGRRQAIEKFKQAAVEAIGGTSAPQQGQARAHAADEELAKVKGDATLLRQWHVYQRLITTLVLPPDKQLFKTLEDAKAGKNLESTYRRARARQAELGIELVPKNDEYIKKVASVATLTYQKLSA